MLILNRQAASTFNRCTSIPLPTIKRSKEVKPIAKSKPYWLPKHWQFKVREGLEKDVQMGIIEKVPVNTPTTWLSRMVVVPKHNGEHHRTVDFKDLKRASNCQTHQTRLPYRLAMDVPKYTKKSVLDIWN